MASFPNPDDEWVGVGYHPSDPRSGLDRGPSLAGDLTRSPLSVIKMDLGVVSWTLSG